MEETSSTQKHPPLVTGAPFPRVVCAVDGTAASLSAVEQAAALAGADAHLTLLLATAFRFAGEHRSPAIGPLKAEGMLDAAEDVARRSGVPFSVEVDPSGAPSEVILDWAESHDLLAIGAPSTRWLASLFMGGVAAGAERTLNTSLLVARPLAATPSPRRMLIASDALEGSDELVALGARLAQLQGTGALLLHALGAESESHPLRIDSQAEVLREVLGSDAEVRIERGNARSAVIRVADEIGATIVIMGSRRRHGVRAIGSVSRRVVHEGHCSVLLLAPERMHGPAGTPASRKELP